MTARSDQAAHMLLGAAYAHDWSAATNDTARLQVWSRYRALGDAMTRQGAGLVIGPDGTQSIAMPFLAEQHLV